ncbi:MAG: hypothetical protein ACO3JL_21050, partial [Myxococcota bacterium]
MSHGATAVTASVRRRALHLAPRPDGQRWGSGSLGWWTRQVAKVVLRVGERRHQPSFCPGELVATR